MESNPCNVCGGTELNLVDGYYYCVECGTQDVNVQETLVEHTILADGTIALSSSRKFITTIKDGLEMSSEWYKWHIFNFILVGLTDELISLGAKPSVKMKVLWIWMKYIKKFQVKDHFENSSKTVDDSFKVQIDNDIYNDVDSVDEEDESKKSKERFRKDITTVTKGTLFAILYVALNLDRSVFQLYDLYRFINEGRLSIFNCTKYVPKELENKAIPCWKNFIVCPIKYHPDTIKMIAMTLFKRLELGVPIVPDLTLLFDNYLTELCLPNDFRDFVLSLVNLMPCDFLQIDLKSMKSLVRIPDYEITCMSYIILALKICFGLDCEYELKLSDQVDQINSEENYLKSYKLGYYSESTGRLFSFREWYKFRHFRKTIVCKYYLPFARLYRLPVDDTVLMEHLEERRKRKIKLTDDVTMDILNKIPENIVSNVIPKKKFPPTLTPLTTYTAIILDYIHDPELKLQLSEDFTQYSLKYTTKDFIFPEYYATCDLSIKGVSKTNKTINRNITGTLTDGKIGDTSLVFVRNCENRHWIKTKPPNLDHITKNNNDNLIDNNSNHEYDLSNENTGLQSIEVSDITIDTNVGEKIDIDSESLISFIDEENEMVSIFDDGFENIENDKSNIESTKIESENVFEFYNDLTKVESHSTDSNMTSESYMDPETVDRSKLIQELIEIACKKYKIPKPRQNDIRESRKRKISVTNDEAGTKKKRNNTIRGETKNAINNIMSLYYQHVNNDIFNKVSEQVKSFIDTVNNKENNQLNTSLTMQSNNLNEAEPLNETRALQENTSIPLEDPNVSAIYDIDNRLTLQDTSIDEFVYNLSPKSDPAFDKETHDISQLYVELVNNENIEDLDNLFDIKDTELNDIIDKKIKEFESGKLPTPVEDGLKNGNSFSDSEDDLPLIILQEETKYNRKNKENAAQKVDPLLTNPNKIKQFSMWIRHYGPRCMPRIRDSTEKFDIELSENFPSSFVFVIRECAAILDCTPFRLYKAMSNLEERLLCFKN